MPNDRGAANHAAMSATTTLAPATAEAIRRAMTLAQRGDLRGAARAGEEALASGGRDPVPLNAMTGMFYTRLGESDRALPFLRAAHAGRPDDVMIATNLVEALFAADDKQAAFDTCTIDLATRDPSLKLMRLRAFLAQSLEDFEPAVEAYRRVVDAAPDDWESWNNLGNAHAGLEDHAAAVEALQQALTLNPDSAPTRLNLALELACLGKVDESEALLRDAIARDPTDARCATELAGILRLRGPSDDVVDQYERALTIDPDNIALRVQHATEARLMNRFGEAEASYTVALDREPNHGLANLGFARMLDNLNREHEIAPLLARAERAGVESGVAAVIRAFDHRRARRFAEGLDALADVPADLDSAAIHHLRGEFLNGLGRHDEAFAAYRSMNEEYRLDPSRPEERAAAYADLVRSDFATVSPAWFDRWGPPAAPDVRPAPVFLVGFPRSGTTLLDTLLMGHPGVEILEEEPTLREVSGVLQQVEELPDASPEQLEHARDKYWETAGKLTPLAPGRLLVDKNPLLMNKLPLIRRLFPDARIILAVRHPCDVVLSCYITNFSLNAGMANFLTLESAANLYDLSFRSAERAIEVMKLSAHTVKYENIVADRESELRTLFDFLGLEWNEAVLDHQSTARGRDHIKTASYAQVVQPIYTRAAGRWERYRAHLEPILPILEPWIAKFGYTA